MSLTLKLIFFVSFFSILLFGQDPDSLVLDQVLGLSLEELMDVKVNVSSVKPLNLLETPSSVSVIDRETIESFNFLSVAEALAIVPGMDVLQTIIDWNVATSRGILQNFYANKVLLMINSIPTWQPIYGDFHLERIDINDVERIEVLKGPASVLYGTNAYAGVINIILRDQKKSTIDAYSHIGYPNIFGGGINARYTKDKLNLFLSANTMVEDRKPYEFEAEGTMPYNGDTTYYYNERYQTGNFILRGSYNSHSILLNGFNFDHTFLGAIPSYGSGGGTIIDNSGILINYQYKDEIFDNIHFIGNLTYDYFKRHFPLSADRSQLIKLSGTRWSGEGKFNFYIAKYFSFELGGHGEIRDSHGHETWYAITDTLSTSNMLNDANNYEGSVFMQPEFIFGKFSLLLGGRYTKNSSFGDDFSFRSTALYKLNSNNSIKLIIGESFRVPTMFELYFNHITVKGNTELKPEKSVSGEIAYLIQKGNFFIQATGYMASYSDLIKRVVVPGRDTAQYFNSDNFMGKGFELEIRYRKKNWGNFYTNYNYIASHNNTGAYNYNYVPEHTLSFGLKKMLRNFYFYSKGEYISSTHGLHKDIPSQVFIDAGLGVETKVKDLKIKHNIVFKNISGSDFMMPQYIRDQSTVNDIPTMGYGRRIIYTLTIRY